MFCRHPLNLEELSCNSDQPNSKFLVRSFVLMLLNFEHQDRTRLMIVGMEEMPSEVCVCGLFLRVRFTHGQPIPSESQYSSIAHY